MENSMNKNHKSGFTLIELLVVVLIVGILSAVALPQYSTAVEKTRSAEALSLMNAIAGAAERYCFQKDVWPTTLSELDIEVPHVSGSETDFGGKNFKVEFSVGTGESCTDTNKKLVISATRGITDGYILKTTLTPKEDETIEAKRTCTSDNTKGTTYCNSITNGHNDGF